MRSKSSAKCYLIMAPKILPPSLKVDFNRLLPVVGKVLPAPLPARVAGQVQLVRRDHRLQVRDIYFPQQVTIIQIPSRTV